MEKEYDREVKQRTIESIVIIIYCIYVIGTVVNIINNDWQKWADRGILAVEREAYALFSTAAQLHKEALAILTISDSLVNHQETTSEERVKSFTHRREVALDCIKE